MANLRKSPLTRNENIFANRFYTISGVHHSKGVLEIQPPVIRYNVSEQSWQFSNDGVIFYNFNGTSSGSIGDLSQKVGEIVQSEILEGTLHTLPSSITYTVTLNGNKLDVFQNGQLLTPKIGSNVGDYTEVDSSTIQFNFNVPKGTLLTYIIK